MDFDAIMEANKFCGCWVCPEYIRKPVILRKAKYCWLYPKYGRRELRKMIPKPDEEENLYTRCDFVLEQCAQETILCLEDQLKAYAETSRNEIKIQTKLLKEMWRHAQRFKMLNREVMCIKLYPDVLLKPMETVEKCHFKDKLELVNKSICRLAKALNEIRLTVEKLNYRCSLLDMNVKSTFIQGNWKMKSLCYIRTIIGDLVTYHYDIFCKLKSWSQLLDINDIISVDDYLTLLKSTSNHKGFVYVYQGKCGCQRTRNPECIIPHIPC